MSIKIIWLLIIKVEHKIFKIVRNKVNIPFWIRLFFWIVFILISLVPIILPIFPGSIFIGVFFIVLWFLLIVPWHKLRHVRKMRKWIIYLAKNIHKKRIIKHKIKDFKIHIQKILKEKKEHKIQKK